MKKNKSNGRRGQMSASIGRPVLVPTFSSPVLEDLSAKRRRVILGIQQTLETDAHFFRTYLAIAAFQETEQLLFVMTQIFLPTFFDLFFELLFALFELFVHRRLVLGVSIRYCASLNVHSVLERSRLQ